MDQIFADEDALGEILWALTDKQGTVRDVADYDAASDTTTVVNHIQYDSFGNIISESNPAVEFLYAFTGRVWDADAELYYYRARWYDPATGRFVSEDPIGFGGGDVNLTRYVGNGATNFVDPSGLEWFWNWEWSQAGDNYIANLTGPNSFGAGLVDGAAGVAKSLNPVNVWNRAKGIPAGLRNDWRKIQSMCNAPKEYFWRRYDVISGGISNQFSTPAGWGEAYVYGASAVVGGKIGAKFPRGARNVPSRAVDTLNCVRRTGQPPTGYRGGRAFRNDGRGGGQVLPRLDANFNPITYREYDVNPYQNGVNRGPERLVIGNDRRAYYTGDHYGTFTEISP